MFSVECATFPTPSLETINITGARQSFVADLSIASFVINLFIRIVWILFSSKSEDEIQGILPFQKLAFDDEGVPPPTKSPNSLNVTFFHSPENSGNLKFGTLTLQILTP